MKTVIGTLREQEHGHQPAICIQGNCIDRADTAGCNGKGWRDDDVSFTLNTEVTWIKGTIDRQKLEEYEVFREGF